MFYIVHKHIFIDIIPHRLKVLNSDNLMYLCDKDDICLNLPREAYIKATSNLGNYIA